MHFWLFFCFYHVFLTKIKFCILHLTLGRLHFALFWNHVFLPGFLRGCIFDKCFFSFLVFCTNVLFSTIISFPPENQTLYFDLAHCFTFLTKKLVKNTCSTSSSCIIHCVFWTMFFGLWNTMYFWPLKLYVFYTRLDGVFYTLRFNTFLHFNDGTLQHLWRWG